MGRVPKNEKISKLREIIRQEALFKTDGKRGVVFPGGDSQKWVFDIRHICLKSEFLNLFAETFWEIFEKDYPFQIGGQELAAIPLVSSVVLWGEKIGKPVNGFIVRKSAKVPEYSKMIEGEITDDKIILLDDAVTSGRSMLHGIKVIAETGKKADNIFFLVECGGGRALEIFEKQQIKFKYLFNLSDFNFILPEKEIIKSDFREIWRFAIPKPNYYYIVPKSAPAIDEKNLYFGSDDGFFWALRQDDGSVLWKFKVGYPIKGKSIFSSPAIYEDKVYFGSYDGNVYALGKDTGEVKWKFGEADWVGSSPAIAPDLGLLFIGLEFGLFRKKGGIAALDLETGEKIWDHRMEEYIHSSPAYCPGKKVIAIGGNDRCVYMFRAKNGKLLWKFEIGGEIKASFDFDTKRNLVLFGSFDNNFYALDIDTGGMKGKFETKDAIYSTPKVYEDNVYFTSTDKTLYSLNLDSGKLNWRFMAGGRIFSSPEIIKDKILIGATDGILYEISVENGKCESVFQASGGITNKIAYNPKTKKYFIPTYSNKIYCLKK